MRRRETDLGPPVIAWLGEQGFADVYQEVSAWSGVADLVATAGPLVAVIEMKVSLSWELLSQAIRWRGVAHQVWVAVPAAKSGDGRRMAERVFEDNGVGVLSVNAAWTDVRVDLMARPAFNRRAEVQRVTKHLHQEQKTYAAAGARGGRHWSEFRSTCDKLRRYIIEHPGVTMREAIAEVRHHYASDAGARSRLVALIQRGVVEGVRAERDGMALRLYATALESKAS